MAAWIAKRPKVLLFGDSITARSFDSMGWGASLAHYYMRKADVVNRGLGGYNTSWAKHVLQHVLDEGYYKESTLFATVFFGANDAVHPEGPTRQHVPVAEYKDNLKLLVNAIKAHGISTVILLTPPPLYEAGYARCNTSMASGGMDRTNAYAQQYALACKQLAQEMELPVVDLWSAMQTEDNWGERFFCDGLHLTPEGNQCVFQALLDTINTKCPHVKSESLPLHYPPWDAIDRENPSATFSPLKA